MNKFFILLNLISLCCLGQNDSLTLSPHDKKAIIRKIFRSDTINIQISTSGCFSGSETKINIMKVKWHYDLACSGGIYGRTYQRRISRLQMNQAKRVFYKGFNVKKGYCTSSYVMTAKNNKQTVDFFDRTCRRNLDDKLQKKLGIYKAMNNKTKSAAQADTTNKKYSYLVCAEFKKDCKPGHIVTNQRTAIADTTVAFLSGKIVDDKNVGLPFATMSLTNNISKVKYSCTTDLDGNYKLVLAAGQYTFKTVAFGFAPLTLDSLTLGTGAIHTLNIDIGEYCCLKTKKVTTDTPMQDSGDPIEIKK